MRAKKSKLIIALGFSVLIAIMIMVTLGGFFRFTSIHDQINQLSEAHFAKTNLIYRMHLAVRERTISLVLMANLQDPFDMDEEMLRFNQLGTEFAAARTALMEFPLSTEERKALEQQRDFTLEARPLHEKLIDYALTGNSISTQRFLTQTAIPKQNMVIDTLKELHKVEDSKYYELLYQLTNHYRQAYALFMALLSISTIGFGVVITLFVARKIESIENELFKEKERYALAVRGANDGLWDWDLVANEIYFSPRWKDMLGYEDHELENTQDEWLKRIHPDDSEKLLAELNNHLNGLSYYFENENRLLHKNGKYCWFLTRGLALRDEKGKAYRIAGSQSDITERKRSEKHMNQKESRMRTVLDHVVDGIITTSERGIIESMNHAAEEIFGIKPEEMVGHPLIRLLPDPFKNEYEKYFGEYANTGMTSMIAMNNELRGLRSPGITFPLTFNVTEMQLGNDRKLIFIARDISQRQNKLSA